MKIVCLNGSPRLGGNTNFALQTLEAQAKKAFPEAAVDHVDLGVLALRPFTFEGCALKDDDTAKVLDQVVGADVLVMGSPVYCWGISAQLKMVIDNFEACCAALKEKPKKVVMVTVGAAPVEHEQYGLIDRQIRCMAEFMSWTVAGVVSFSAFDAGGLAKQDGVAEALASVVGKLA